VSQKEWASQYFANISVNFYCSDLNFLRKDSSFNSLQNLHKTFYCKNWLWNIRGWRLQDTKMTYFVGFIRIRCEACEIQTNWISHFEALFIDDNSRFPWLFGSCAVKLFLFQAFRIFDRILGTLRKTRALMSKNNFLQSNTVVVLKVNDLSIGLRNCLI
jgi:hypothetical protein